MGDTGHVSMFAKRRSHRGCLGKLERQHYEDFGWGLGGL